MLVRRSIVFSFVICVIPALARAANFTISDSSLTIGIPGEASAGFFDIDLPFSDAHATSIGNSAVSASYEFTQQRLLVETVIASADDGAGNSTIAATGVSFVLTTGSEDLIIEYDGRFDFDLPMDSMTSTFDLAASDADNSTVGFVVDPQLHNTIFGTGPRTFEKSGQFVIPANTTSFVSILFRISANPSSAPAIGTGDGFLELRFIPEPTSAMFALVVATFSLAKRRRSSLSV